MLSIDVPLPLGQKGVWGLTPQVVCSAAAAAGSGPSAIGERRAKTKEAEPLCL